MNEPAPMQDEIARHRACFGNPGTNTRNGEDIPAPTKGAGRAPVFDFTTTKVEFEKGPSYAIDFETRKRGGLDDFATTVRDPAYEDALTERQKAIGKRIEEAMLRPLPYTARFGAAYDFKPFKIMDLDMGIDASPFVKKTPAVDPNAWNPPLTSKVNAESVTDSDQVDYIPPELVERRKARRDLNPLRLKVQHVENERAPVPRGGCGCSSCRAMYKAESTPEPDYSRADRDGLPPHVVGRYDIPKPTRGTLKGKATVEGFGFTVKEVKIDRGNPFDFFRAPPSGFKRVLIHTEIISRDTGKPMALYFSNDFPVGRPDAACIRELLIEAVRHEIEECIFVDGVRVWDPHVNGRNEI